MQGRGKGSIGTRLAGWFLLLLLLAWGGMAVWQTIKPLPEDVGKAWPLRSADEIQFLSDRTWYDAQGQRHLDQQIFDEVLNMIGQARRLIVMDMFLFNSLSGESPRVSRHLAEELSQALIQARREHPQLRVVVISDPLNTFYGGVMPEHFRELRDAGVEVVFTELDRLRASNPLWSGLWHLGLNRLGNDPDGGWLPNIFKGPDVTLRSYLAMLNFRANHRKTLVVDQQDAWVTLITSANPHDGSSRHGNVALRIRGDLALDVMASEAAVADWSGVDLELPQQPPSASGEGPRTQLMTVQLLTEAAIRDASLELIDAARSGDRLDMAAFYLAHRQVITALKEAEQRGAMVRVLLDPNREAFGFAKGGLPNQPVAAELHDAGVEVRWCLTAGEQCHSKVLHLAAQGGKDRLILGSANMTRRNLDDYNLETSVLLSADASEPTMQQVDRWFEQRWQSSPQRRTSRRWQPTQRSGWFDSWRYRIMEATGLSTF
ncbi:phospholipase D-like domain-containing protein [Halomonas cupida]|uniref:phospholipase D n=1 Tax=Halomonas cupida TaxID=44933 RepID=A0A1M7AK31_9GAMM|nr:phospholipase D-like domain-containing protein [Halomonas cupida]GEN22350.1 phospholipase D [Halomonas cupida]SHL43142.1 Phosphatidylserine/phosphatidylglycerophosphate/cardiolipin synthase [Halomonas cupida]